MIELHLLDLIKLLEKYNYSALAKLIQKVEAKQAEFIKKGKEFGSREVAQYCPVRDVREARAILEFVNQGKKNQAVAVQEQRCPQEPHYKIAA